LLKTPLSLGALPKKGRKAKVCAGKAMQSRSRKMT
jgi:hypothetical protein